MTKDDKRWLEDVASLGCVVCRNLGYGATPAEVHHIRKGQGIAQRADHKKTLPLCPPHHRTGGHGITFMQNLIPSLRAADKSRKCGCPPRRESMKFCLTPFSILADGDFAPLYARARARLGG